MHPIIVPGKLGVLIKYCIKIIVKKSVNNNILKVKNEP